MGAVDRDGPWEVPEVQVEGERVADIMLDALSRDVGGEDALDVTWTSYCCTRDLRLHLPGPSTYVEGPYLLGHMVGVAGFEPTASSSRTKRATKLRHTPAATGTA